MSAIGSSLIQAGATLVGGVLNANSQNRVNAEARRQFDANMAWQKYQYEDSKKYNSASEQVRRLREAGINPMLAYSGDAGSSQPVAASSPTAQQNAVDYSGVMNAGAAIGNALSQQELQRKQSDNLDADTAMKESQAYRQDVQNRFAVAKEMGELEEQQASIKEKLSQKDLNDEQRSSLQKQSESLAVQIEMNRKELSFLDDYLLARNDTQREEANYKREQVLSERVNRRATELHNEWQSFQNSLKPLHVQVLQKSILEAVSRIDLNSKNAAESVARAALTLAEKRGVNIDNVQRNKVNWIVREGLKLDITSKKLDNAQRKYNLEHPYSAQKIFDEIFRGEVKRVPTARGVTQ